MRHASPRRKRGADRVERSRLPNNDATLKIADCDIFAIFGRIAPNRGGLERNEERMNYSLEDLKSELAAMEPGEETCVAYGQYALLFPPGEPDQGARNAAVAFAKADDCTVSNRRDDNLVCFVRPAK